VKAVATKYSDYPWAFTWPTRPGNVGPIRHARQLNDWLTTHGLVAEHDYISFEVNEAPPGSRFANWTYCIAFKSRDMALMYKMAWA
jgi:hypothetical protein